MVENLEKLVAVLDYNEAAQSMIEDALNGVSEYEYIWYDETFENEDGFTYYGELYELYQNEEEFKNTLKEKGLYDKFGALFRNFDWDLSYHYEDFLYEFKAALDNVNSDAVYIVKAKGMNWRNASGYKTVRYNGDAEEFLRGIAPDTDYTMRVYDNDEDGTLLVKVYHHDVPCGSTMVLLPIEKAIAEMDKETKIDLIKYLIDDTNTDERFLYSHVLEKKSENEYCITRYINRYADAKLNALLTFFAVDDDCHEEVAEVYIKSLKNF